MGLLPGDMNAPAVAKFLRACPGLNKQTTGELLGEYDDFFLEVLREFTDTFDFSGLPLSAPIPALHLPCCPFKHSKTKQTFEACLSID